QKFYGRGVSYCAPCDIAFYLKQPVMITGLGENLVKAALYLSGYVKHVYVVTRSSLIQGAATLVRDVMKEPKITFYLESEVERLDGKEKLESIRIYKNGDHSESVLDVSVLFIYEAIEGNADFLDSSPGIEVTDELLVRTGVTMQTGVAGIYAIGGVREGGGKRLIVAVSDALVAVNHIQNYLYFLK
ncbi:MAG: NAD(P)/FAD-dependent oxidoreductase, partial [Candidatus Margulisiibacteriota bacterium]